MMWDCSVSNSSGQKAKSNATKTHPCLPDQWQQTVGMPCSRPQMSIKRVRHGRIVWEWCWWGLTCFNGRFQFLHSAQIPVEIRETSVGHISVHNNIWGVIWWVTQMARDLSLFQQSIIVRNQIGYHTTLLRDHAMINVLLVQCRTYNQLVQCLSTKIHWS